MTGRVRREQIAEISAEIERVTAEAERVRDRWIALSSFGSAEALGEIDGVTLTSLAAELQLKARRVRELRRELAAVVSG